MISASIRAFPTFKFYVNGVEVYEMKGANPSQLEDMVLKYKPASIGPGQTLGTWDGVGNPPGPPVDPREARIKAFAPSSTPTPVAPPDISAATEEG